VGLSSEQALSSKPQQTVEDGEALVRRLNALNSNRATRPEAERAAAKAIAALRKQPGMERSLSEAYGALGEARWFLKGGAAALRAYRVARQIAERVAPEGSEQLARTLDNEALCLQDTGRFHEAMATQQKALDIAVAIGLTARARRIRLRMSNVLQDQRFFAAAAQLLADARPPRGATAEERVGWFHSNALLFERWNRLLEAETWYDRATTLFERQARQCPDQVGCLVTSAMLKLDLGGVSQARRLLEVGRRLAPPHPPGSYTTLRSVTEAVIAAQNGNIDEASRFMDEALGDARRRHPDALAHQHEIIGMHADLLTMAGQSARSLALLEATLDAAGAAAIDDDNLPLAMPLAELLLGRRQAARAGRLLTRIFACAPTTGEWRSLAATADLAAKRNRPDSAILFGKLAVMKTLQSAMPFTDGSFQRTTIMLRQQTPFLQLTEWLVRDGRFVEAAKIRALLNQQRALDLVARNASATKLPVSDLLTDREMVLKDAYDSARSALWAADLAGALPNRPPAQRRRARQELNRARRQLLALYHAAMRKRRRLPKRTSPPEGEQAALPPRGVAVLRYYFVGRKGVVEVATHDEVGRVTLAVSNDSISQAVFDFVEAVRGSSPCQAAAQSLYRDLFRPLEPLLEAITKLEIVVDGALANLPFCALHDGKVYLVDRFELAYRSGVTKRQRRPRGTDGMAAFGVSRAWGNLPPLRDVPGELKAATRGLANKLVHQDRRFNDRSLRSALTAGWRRVHIASHYHLVPGSPSRSFLLLGDGKKMSTAQFLSEEFDWSATDLLFLSACEAATSDTRFGHAESLAAALHLRGLGVLIASVWPAIDKSTAALVEAFYGEVAKGRTIAAALKHAQSAMARSGRAGEHPMHWAGFKLFVRGL
jgi:CHAT domain-containing protein